MTVFDYVVIAGVALSTVMGFWRGVVSELLALAAWVLAAVAGKFFAPSVAQLLAGWIPESGMRYVAAFALVVVAVLLLVSMLRLLISGLLRAIGLGFADRSLGAVFGFGRGVLIVLVCVAAGGLTAFPKQMWWRDAVLAPPLETAVVALKPWMPQQWASKIRFR